jgi:replicative DNA helicase Mcm
MGGGLLKRLKPLSKGDKSNLNAVKEFVSKERLKLITKLLKEKKISIEKFELDSSVVGELEFPQIKSEVKNVDADDVNKDIKNIVMKKAFDKFSKNAFDILPNLIAPGIKGMEHVKKAAVLQLFSSQPIHILLLGDPGTGKTDILRAIFNLSLISSFGLGSGTSGAGLVVTVKGSKIMKGILPLADEGICCIDELNLMKEESRAGLYNAMEKGFVTYDKGGNHYRFDSRVRVLATANPKGDKFTGRDIKALKEELPFDSALLTRFHLTFFIKKPGAKEFKEIADKIVSQDKDELNEGDVELIKSYIDYTSKIIVEDISKKLQDKIVEFITELKKDEDKYIIEISPRLIIGFMRLCKALARIEARTSVSESDVEKIKKLVSASLVVN